MELKRQTNESEFEYKLRLIVGKIERELDLDWSEIKDLIGVEWNPDHLRKTAYGIYETYKYYKDKEFDMLKFANNKRVLIISDLHIPDIKEEMFFDIITKNKYVDLIILNGDIIDCKAVSSWFDEDITILDHELIKAHQILSKVREITNAKIVLVKGNHENRVNAYYAKNAKSMGSAVVETEILYKLANGFTIKRQKQNKREVYEPIKDVVYCDNRSYLIGDLLVNHPSTYKKDYLKTVATMYNEKLKLKYPNANVFVCGHTHQLGMTFAEDGKVLMESGCLCNPMSYADKDDRPMKMQQYGYIYLEMKDNKVDIDSIKVNYLGHDEIVNSENEEDF